MHSSIRPRWPFRQWAPSICSVGEEEINCLACSTTLVFVVDDDDRKPSSRNFIRRHQLVCHKIRRGRRRGKGYTIYCAAPGWMVGREDGHGRHLSNQEAGKRERIAVVATWQWQAVQPTDSPSVGTGKAAADIVAGDLTPGRSISPPPPPARMDGGIKPGN